MLYICSWYAYDSWNRVQTMTYPDGEVVAYHYNQDRWRVLRAINRDIRALLLTG